MKTKSIEKISGKEKTSKSHQLILFNDDVNTFDDVIELLVKYCNQNEIQAEQCAMLVHHTGRCSIKEGSFEELFLIGEMLSVNGLTVEIK